MHAFIRYRQMWYPIPPGDLIRIGSAGGCDIQLSHDAFISRRHCSVACIGQELTILDLGSSHGTLVNGRPLSNEPQRLRDGDHIMIGNTELDVALRTGDPVF